MKKVLIVDDSETIRQVVARTLEAAGFIVVAAADGVEGLALASTDPDIALALVDVNMPRLNGLDMLAQLREHAIARELPVLMLTTEAERSSIERAKQLGAKGWIVKPAKPDLLVSAVSRLAR